MEKEFIPYEQALALKELGFNEPCLGFYCDEGNRVEPHYPCDGLNRAPLYQQAFRWFREKYNLDASMSVNVWGEKQTSYRITGGIKGVIEANSYGALYDIDTEYYNSYEEAELKCLKKLIEIVKK